MIGTGAYLRSVLGGFHKSCMALKHRGVLVSIAKSDKASTSFPIPPPVVRHMSSSPALVNAASHDQGNFTRICQPPHHTQTTQKRSAGRWTEQPLAQWTSWLPCRRFSTPSFPRESNSDPPKEEDSPAEHHLSSIAGLPAKSPEREVHLSREAAAPLYFHPESADKEVYRTVKGPGGKTLAGFRLWKKAIDASQCAQESYQLMSNIERSIYIDHMRAVGKKEMSYIDPYTGYSVMTVTQLLLNRECCGNGCRHCPYNHEKVPVDERKKYAWNGAFYVTNAYF